MERFIQKNHKKKNLIIKECEEVKSIKKINRDFINALLVIRIQDSSQDSFQVSYQDSSQDSSSGSANLVSPSKKVLGANDLKVEGNIPEELSGTYLRVGPNPSSGWSPHWFFRDGMLHGISLESRI